MTVDLDANTLLPINMNTVYFDLEASNSSGTPTWSEFNYQDDFKLSDLSPASFYDFAARVKEDLDISSLWKWTHVSRYG